MDMLVIGEEVRTALSEGRAVVALESTIIAHGLPCPANLSLARDLEEAVRSQGAVPATIAVIDGSPHIGLRTSELERLALDGHTFRKAGSADLAVTIASGMSAATTVSATSQLAVMAGIRLFATGGIGGAHREDPNDVSADLVSLSRLPIAVVSAGPKAILDLPRTAELLETMQVPIVGYRTSSLPAFYCSDSEVSLEHRLDNVGDVARLLEVRFDLLRQGGVLIANPVPQAHALERSLVEGWVQAGHEAAVRDGVVGKALTPYLLAFVARASGGRAVETNCALARNNAVLAAQIAGQMAKNRTT